jgi:YEATS domain-containing protein 4
MVRSEVVEYIEFNEPTEGLYDALTSENQWDYMSKPRGKGKGRNSMQMQMPAPHDRTVELPDNAPQGSVYSKDTEDALLKDINNAVKKLEVEMAEVLRKTTETQEETQKIKAATVTNSELLKLHDKLPPAPAAPATKKR